MDSLLNCERSPDAESCFRRSVGIRAQIFEEWRSHVGTNKKRSVFFRWRLTRLSH
ncbi:MAG: hypothetical protein WBA57_09130 [Elainellaceae cyanobacterium]